MCGICSKIEGKSGDLRAFYLGPRRNLVWDSKDKFGGRIWKESGIVVWETGKMKILAVETSTKAGSIALIEDEELLREYLLNMEATHSERLLPIIERLLAESKLSPKEVEGFAVSLGPGSFTGLRVGISTVKGLAFATQRPIVGIPTLDGLAYNLIFTSFLICPILDAKKKEVYAALYKGDQKGGLKKLTSDLVLPPLELLKHIQKRVVFLGEGIKIYRQLFEEKLGKLALFAPLHLNVPRAASIAQLSLPKFLKGDTLEPEDLCPLYVRPSEAEMKRR